MADRPKLTLVESLKKSLEVEEQKENNVVDFSKEKIDRAVERGELTANDVTPAQLLSIISEDVERLGNVVKCYVTLIAEDDSSFTVSNYRAGLSRSEEVAFRQLGLQEAVDNWRFGPTE